MTNSKSLNVIGEISKLLELQTHHLKREHP